MMRFYQTDHYPMRLSRAVAQSLDFPSRDFHRFFRLNLEQQQKVEGSSFIILNTVQFGAANQRDELIIYL